MKTIKKLELKCRRIKLSTLAAEEQAKYFNGLQVTDPGFIEHMLTNILSEEDQEIFLVLLLDVRNHIIGYVEAAKGTVDKCPVDMREIFRAAVLVGASAIIMCHNHPSGDSTPSPEDIRLTRRAEESGNLLGIPVLDHVIVTPDDGSTSFAEMGMMGNSFTEDNNDQD